MLQSSTKTLNSEYSEDSVPNSLCTVSTLQICTTNQTGHDTRIRVYKRRIWMLLLYVILATLSSMLFSQYVSMANVIGCYYGVTQSAVNWTTQIYLLVYAILVVPASFLMNYMDLRWTLICGSTLNLIACILQFLTLKSNGFPFVIISSFFGALGSVFIVALAPFLSARWFPSNELSRACAYGNFGNTIGVSIGFIFSPLMVSNNCTSTYAIEEGKRNVAYILTVVNVVVLILLLFTFQNAPELPPNIGQLIKKEENLSARNTSQVILGMMKNKDFILMFILSGLMSGSFYAFTTIANNLMIRYFPNEEVNIAFISNVYTLMGIVGSVVGGYILDYTHRFKETAVTFCFMSLLLYIVFSCLLPLKIIWVQYLTTGVFGFFAIGFMPIGLECGIETVFPASEMISSNLQFWAMQLFGLIVVQIVSQLLDIYGPLYSHVAMGVNLAISSIIASFMTRNYRRSKRNPRENSNGIN